ncbi:CvpA family protein [Desulforhopalus sp. IMCC35007]|uniref:CvpA family protein n=1 Tax=Desulforhopalus sp. IMCC35007 TaxID=2569543 RepID=UPI0010AEE4A2|nr:CvpA family protein [Desulforhopalus sp. IMCC35007]TKB12224.1 CvpA family protein [Desulforhopalus sp. IMCC35007]
MDGFGSLTPYDMVILGLFAVLIGRGIWLGLLKQVTGLVALYLGYFSASQYHDVIFPVLKNVSDNPKVVFLTSYVLLFVVTYVVVMLFGKALGYVISLTITSWFDKILGGLVGFAKALILAVMLHMILGTVLAPENQMLRACMTCDALNEAADFTRKFIRDENVRQSLLQQEPAIAIDSVKKYLTPTPTDEKSE